MSYQGGHYVSPQGSWKKPSRCFFRTMRGEVQKETVIYWLLFSVSGGLDALIPHISILADDPCGNYGEALGSKAECTY